jgi:hypothetical protein
MKSRQTLRDAVQITGAAASLTIETTGYFSIVALSESSSSSRLSAHTCRSYGLNTYPMITNDVGYGRAD